MFLKDSSETLEISPWKCSLDSKEHLSVIDIEEEQPSDCFKISLDRHISYLAFDQVDFVALIFSVNQVYIEKYATSARCRL